MTDSDPTAEGARRAGELLRLLADGDVPAAERLLAPLDRRELVFTGAGLTTSARAEARRLPPAQRAQASARQTRLGRLRDSSRHDPDGLREWLHRAAEEVLLLRSVDVGSYPDPQGRAARAASGSVSTSSPPTST